MNTNTHNIVVVITQKGLCLCRDGAGNYYERFIPHAAHSTKTRTPAQPPIKQSWAWEHLTPEQQATVNENVKKKQR